MNEKDFDLLLVLADNKQYRKLAAELSKINAIDSAEFLEELPLAQATVVFRLLEKDYCVDVFAELSAPTQEYIINEISNVEVANIIEELFVDDAVDMLGEMPATVVRRVLKNATPETRVVINRFLNYPDDSAGAVMTSEYVDLKKEQTVAQAINFIKSNGVDKETVYVCYVTDSERVLEGVVSFRDLLFAKPEQTVGEVMSEDCISVQTTDDQEFAASQIGRYNLLAIPVTDGEKRLVGIVTYDDAFDVIEDETTEDFHRMAAVAPSERPYLETGVFAQAGHRVVWLLFLMVASILSGLVVGRYEAAIGAIPLLVSFMPMITDTSGNAGAQASTLIIRGMSLSEIDLGDWLRVAGKELCVALLCGTTLAAINFVRIIVFNPGQMLVALSVSLSLIAAVALAKAIGCLLPMGAKLLRLDPAVLAAPLITTLVDTLSLFTYFGIASALLGV